MNPISSNRDAINSAALPIPIEQVAQILGLKQEARGEWHGDNPFDPNGATENGFILFEDNGMAWDRKTGEKYTTDRVQAMARGEFSSPVPLPVNGAPKPSVSKAPFQWKTAKIYLYPDEQDELLLEIGRCEAPGCEKSLSQRRPDGAGGWIYGLKAGLYEPTQRGDVSHWYPVKDPKNPKTGAREFPEVRRVLYHLPDVLKANTVFICEGEKATDALNDKLKAADLYGDHVATTNSQGALKWQDEFSEALDAKAVIVLPDNDDSGAKHAAQVCASIRARGKTQSLKRLDLPNLPPKGDAADFFSSGSPLDALLELVSIAPDWKPEEKTSRFQFLSLDQVMNQKPPSWLVDRLLVEGGTSLITAKHASFKSFFALDLALCIATGKKWHGREVKRGTVIYIAAEGASTLQKRIRAWLEYHGVDPEEATRLLVVPSPVQLHDASVLPDFIAETRPLEPTLIIVDTLARCSVGLDENSAGDMNRYVDAVDALSKATGVHVLTVHHNNKDGAYRGSTALPAAVDTHISLDRKGDQVMLKVEKQKDADEGPNLGFSKLEIGESLVIQYQGEALVEEIKAGLTATQRRVYEALLSFGSQGATYSQWKKVAEEMGITADSFKKMKPKLREKGEALLLSGFEGVDAVFIAREAKTGA